MVWPDIVNDIIHLFEWRWDYEEKDCDYLHGRRRVGLKFLLFIFGAPNGVTVFFQIRSEVYNFYDKELLCLIHYNIIKTSTVVGTDSSNARGSLSTIIRNKSYNMSVRHKDATIG